MNITRRRFVQMAGILVPAAALAPKQVFSIVRPESLMPVRPIKPSLAELMWGNVTRADLPAMLVLSDESGYVLARIACDFHLENGRSLLVVEQKDLNGTPVLRSGTLAKEAKIVRGGQDLLSGIPLGNHWNTLNVRTGDSINLYPFNISMKDI